jgi:hypothetical protein
LVEPCPGQASTEGVVGARGDKSEGGEAAADVLAREEGLRVVGAELIEGADAVAVFAGVTEPQALGTE